MKITEELITPEMAEQYLTKNTNNFRKLNFNKVKLYASDMRNGRWEYNGDPIRFNNEGILIDGQHRLNAIVMSHTSVKCVVERGVESNIIDIGFIRTSQDIGKAKGLEAAVCNPTSSGAVRIIIASSFGEQRKFVTKSQILEFQIRYSDVIRTAFSLCTQNMTNSIMRKSPVIAVAICLLHSDMITEKTMQEHAKVVDTGFPKDGHESSSAIVLRNMMFEWKRGNDVEIGIAYLNSVIDYRDGKSRRKAYTVDSEAYKLFVDIATGMCNCL